MKPFLKKLLIPFCFILLTSCKIKSVNQSPTTTESTKKEYSTLLPYDHFDLETYMKPIWLGDTIYNETVVFVGQNDLGKLLYPVEEIISVTSYDLKTVYEDME